MKTTEEDLALKPVAYSMNRLDLARHRLQRLKDQQSDLEREIRRAESELAAEEAVALSRQ
jgi:hypothetical protein